MRRSKSAGSSPASEQHGCVVNMRWPNTVSTKWRISSTSSSGRLLRLVSGNQESCASTSARRRIYPQRGAALTTRCFATFVRQLCACSLRLCPSSPKRGWWHAIGAMDSLRPKSIALSRYPQPLEEALDTAVEAEMKSLQELIVMIRALRKDLGDPPSGSRPLGQEIAARHPPPCEQAAADQPRDYREAGARLDLQLSGAMEPEPGQYPDHGKLYRWTGV